MERFERESSQSIYWFNRSNNLRGAAGAVWFAIKSESSEVSTFLGMESGYSFAAATRPVFTMLCGMSLELLYKAIAVERGEKPGKTHDLNKLACLARVPIDSEESPLLEILSAYIVWAGRYPVPIGTDAKTKWETNAAREWAHLWEKTSTSKLDVRRPNKNLSWKHFQKLWGTGAKAYWKLRPQTSASN